MPDALGSSQLLDMALIATLGPVDAFVSDAIVEICNDALEAVLGAELADALRADQRLLPLVASWIWDLARGLHFQSRQGPGEPPTTEMISLLSRRQFSAAELRRHAETVDLATALTLDRLLEQVLGPGACQRDPREDAVVRPWLAGLKLGYRIHLVLELLRLSAAL